MNLELMLKYIEARFDFKGLFKALFDREIDTYQMKLRHCWGGITFIIILLEILSGIFLAFYYQPSTDKAYQSIVFITEDVSLGWLIRGMHHWCAYLMVITVLIHTLKAFYLGAYKPPREFTWWSGLGLLGVVLALLFTGYLLTWGQQGFWATRISMGMVAEVPFVGEYLFKFAQGGYGIKQPALTRFFWAHVFFFPLSLLGLLGAHFWMIRKHGITYPL